MNAIDNDAYEIVKCHLEEIKNLILAYTVEPMKIVEMKFKNIGTSITKPVHKRRERRKNNDKNCYHCQGKHIRFYCNNWLENTDAGRKYAAAHSKKNSDEKEPAAETKPKTNKIISRRKKFIEMKRVRAKKTREKSSKSSNKNDDNGENKNWMARNAYTDKILLGRDFHRRSTNDCMMANEQNNKRARNE